MYIVYKSVDDFTNMVLFIISRNIGKFVNGFRNIKNNNQVNNK